MKSKVAALFAGLLFGAGLVIAGMTNPAKVLGFLDMFGHWDPSLAFVMIGAIGVHFLLLRRIRVLPKPLFESVFHWPERTAIDAPLILGAALFGVGWGLGGVCPGPGIVDAASGSGYALVFMIGMTLGVLAEQRMLRQARVESPEGPIAESLPTGVREGRAQSSRVSPGGGPGRDPRAYCVATTAPENVAVHSRDFRENTQISETRSRKKSV